MKKINEAAQVDKIDMRGSKNKLLNGVLCGNAVKHGLKSHKTYKLWLNMKERCYNDKKSNYKYYGGRGIIVCDEWRNDFKAFYDLQTKKSVHASIVALQKR